MVTNPPKGDGYRKGTVKDKTQVYNPRVDTWIKRDSRTGQFMDIKMDGTPFKDATKEKAMDTIRKLKDR